MLEDARASGEACRRRIRCLSKSLLFEATSSVSLRVACCFLGLLW